jgi:hypothetical protein
MHRELDRAQKTRLVQGLSVFVIGWGLAIGLVPMVGSMDLTPATKSILVFGVPKLLFLIAVAIMGKPGFAFLKSLVKGQLKRLAPPATVSPLRYRIGLVMFVSVIVLSWISPYVAGELTPLSQAQPQLVAALGDLLLVVSLFVLGGDFWDKLRALFIRDAKVVFPERQASGSSLAECPEISTLR